MSEKERLPVQASVLAWARKTASVTPEAAAKAAGVKVERIAVWEAGEETPSLPQLRKLAEKYKRPLAVMLLPAPPRDFQPLKDFRRITAEQGSAMPSRVALEIRNAYERREIALEMLDEIGEEAPSFSLAAKITDDPDTVADVVRGFLKVTAVDQLKWARKNDTFNGWRAAIEAQGVLVFVMSGPHAPLVKEVRGFAIPAAQMPAVAVNGKDRTNGRTFTLLHEFAHLLIGEGVVENAVAPDPHMPPAVRRIERWCNAVAAAVLMPREVVREVAQGRTPTSEWSDAELTRAAERMGTSREAALIRFVGLGYASRRGYVHKRPVFENEYEELDKPLETSAPIPPYKTMVGKYGRSYARLVLSGYRERRISLNDAAAFLGVQAKHVPYIERQAFRAA